MDVDWLKDFAYPRSTEIFQVSNYTDFLFIRCQNLVLDEICVFPLAVNAMNLKSTRLKVGSRLCCSLPMV